MEKLHLQILLFQLLTVFFYFGIADDVVDCSSVDIVTSIFNEPIDLDFNGTIKIYENVTIGDVVSTSNNEFSVNYIDARLEFASNESDFKNLIIFTTENFTNYAHEQTATRLTLKIMLECETSRERTLIFFQPINEKNYFAPVFTREIYELFLPTPIFAGFELTSLLEMSARDDDLVNNQVVFSLNKAGSFDDLIEIGTKNLTLSNSKIFFANLTLKQALLTVPENFTFEIIATDTGVPPLNATALVSLQVDENNQLPRTPKFERSLYYGSLDANFTLNIMLISLENDSYTVDVVFSLSGEHAAFFEVENEGNFVHIQLIDAGNLTALDLVPFIELELQARSPKLFDFGRTAVIVQLPQKSNAKFLFVKSLYEGFMDTLGNLDIEPIVFDPAAYSAEINFELHGDHANFFELVQVDNVLSLNFTPNWEEWPSKDNFIALEVLASKDQLQASASVFLKLQSNENLIGSESPVYALIIKEIVEEKEHKNLMNMYQDECRYEILSVYPNEKESSLYVDEQTNTLSTFAIDREDEIFSNMTTPQLRVELQLICPVKHTRSKRQSANLENYNFTDILATDIQYATRRTVLNLIIIDINDNEPIFVYPAMSPFYIGYPDASICFELFPEQLMQVQATDRDAGLNAELQFSVNDSEHFDIDAKTGKIYPRKGFQTENDIQLLITATDRAGSNDGLSTSIIIEVKRLSAENLILLSYEVTSSDTVLEDLSMKTTLNMNFIRHAILPYNLKGAPRFESRHWKYADTALEQAWVYAFKMNEPVLCNELQDKILDVSNLSEGSFIAESFEETGLSSNYSHAWVPNTPNDGIDNSLYIVFLTIIVILIITNCVLLFLFWRRSVFLACCKKPIATPTTNSISLTAQQQNCNTCNFYPVVPADTIDCEFKSKPKPKPKPEVEVVHSNSGVSVEFQLGDDDEICVQNEYKNKK